ncbi:myb/SANT-like DNA-binding domain-containing protein 4 [Saccostrea cucullata]|uniref:myb/SANT-like DNA-binding domain-containing protein 4 n=1 Tax=Saccostrea cuccullata TaxID=36930 RepID=UPI002ED2B88B
MAPPKLTPLQDKIVGIIGPTAIEGISGGLDTCGEFEDACSSLSSASTISLQDKPSTSGNNEMDPPKKVSSRKRHIQDEDNQSSQRLVAIEEERLLVEKERLSIEKERLEVEKQRLENEKQKLIISQQRHQIYLGQLGVQFTCIPQGADTSIAHE